MTSPHFSYHLKKDPLSRAFARLIQFIAAWIRRHPYISASIAVHICAIYFIVSYGTYQYQQYQLSQEKVSIETSLQHLEEVRQKEMHARVDNIEKMKQLLDQTLPEDERESSEENQSPTTEKSKSLDLNDSEEPSDLLARAKLLSKAIQKVSKEIQAEDMARVLNMPKEEAMKKVEEKIAKEQKQLEKEQQENNSKSQSQELAKTNDEIKRIETEAKKVLEKRKQQLDSANNGFKIHPVSAETDPSQQSENSLSKSKSKNKHSSGDGGVSDGHTANSNQAGEAASKRIEEFLAADTGNEQLAFSGSDISRIPIADPSAHKGTGRNFGVGGEFSDRVYLNRWYVIGPFLGRAGAKLFDNPSYPPEDLVDLDAVYIGKNNRILKWQYVFQNEYPFVPPDPTTDAVYYGYNEIKFDHAIDLWGWFGADDDLQVWINNRLAWPGGDINKQALYDIAYSSGDRYWNTWNLTDGKRKVHFEKGINKVLFKLSNGPNPKGVFASIVLTKD